MTRKELVAYRAKLYQEMKDAQRAWDRTGSAKNRRALTAAYRAWNDFQVSPFNPGRQASEAYDSDRTKRAKRRALLAKIETLPCDVCGQLGHREEVHAPA